MKTNRFRSLAAVAAVALILAFVGATVAEPLRERGGRGDKSEARAKRGQPGDAQAPEAAGEGRFGRARGPQAPPPMHGGEGFLQGMIKFWENPRIANRLELNESQIASLNKLHETSKVRLEEVEEEASGVREQIKAEMDKAAPSLDIINGLADQLGTIHAERTKAMLSHRVAVQAILTPGQLEDVDNIRRNMIPHEAPKALEGMREKLRQVESAEELNSILDERGITEPRQRERILKAWERLQEGDAPMPPDAPEAPLPPIF